MTATRHKHKHRKPYHTHPPRPQLNIRVCADLLAALRAHPDWTPYDRGFVSGDSGLAKQLLYDVLGTPCEPNDADRRRGGARWPAGAPSQARQESEFLEKNHVGGHECFGGSDFGGKDEPDV